MSASNFDYREESQKLIDFAKRICETTYIKRKLTKNDYIEHENASDACKELKAEDGANDPTHDISKSKIPVENMLEYPVAQLCNQVAVDKGLNVIGYHDLQTKDFKTRETRQRGHTNLTSPELSSGMSRSMIVENSRSFHGVKSTECRSGSKGASFGRGVNDKRTNIPPNRPLQGPIPKSPDAKLLTGAQNSASNIVDRVGKKCATNQRMDHNGSAALKERGSSTDRGKNPHACVQFNNGSNFAPSRNNINLQDVNRKKLVQSAKKSTKLIKVLLGKTSELQKPVESSSLQVPPPMSSLQEDSLASHGSYADFSESSKVSSMPQSRHPPPVDYPAAFQFDLGCKSFVNTKEGHRYTDSSSIVYPPSNPNHVTDISNLQQAQGGRFCGISNENASHYAQSRYSQLHKPYAPYIIAPTTCNNDLVVPNGARKRGCSLVSRNRSYEAPQAYNQSRSTPSIPQGSSRPIPKPRSTRSQTKRVPKSLRRMGGIAEKYNLQEYND